MKTVADVQKRALTAFDRNWREWAQAAFLGCAPRASLGVGLKPPRESDLSSPGCITTARAWVAEWRDCALPGIEWRRKSWSRVGDQNLPIRVQLTSAEDIALWAGKLAQWEAATARAADVRERIIGQWPALVGSPGIYDRMLKNGGPSVSQGRVSAESETSLAEPSSGAIEDPVARTLADASSAVRSDIAAWCKLDESSWSSTLHVWDWLFSHPGQTCYVRQLPIRGIDTKWFERHESALRGLYHAIKGDDFAFSQPPKLFRCKACCPDAALEGCTEFALSANQLAQMHTRPKRVVLCENLVNTLCLDNLAGTLAIHASGFAAIELGAVPWLSKTPLVYWGDLDSNGFAILNAVRTFAPHARSVMMDEATLMRYFDLGVEEPTPAMGDFPNLTQQERGALAALSQGDETRGIRNLRLEQERIEWTWAYARVMQALGEC